SPRPWDRSRSDASWTWLLDAKRGGPVGHRDPALVLHGGEIDAVQALVALGAEGERRADAEIDVPHRFERVAEAGTRGVRPGPAERLDHHLGVHEALQADEAAPLDG